MDVTQEADEVDRCLQELKARTGQATRDVENRPEVILEIMPAPPAEQRAATNDPFPNLTQQRPDQHGEDAQGGGAATPNAGDQQQADSAEAELARFHEVVDQRVRGLINWANRSRDALHEIQGRVLEAVKYNDKLTKKNLAELNKA